MKKVIGFLLFVLCLGSGYGMYYLYQNADLTAPEITYQGEKTCFEEQARGSDSSKFFLEGAKAVDDMEGDVSSTLIIEQQKVKEDSVDVVYVARDSKNNVSKMEVNFAIITPTPTPTPTPSPTPTPEPTPVPEIEETAGDSEEAEYEEPAFEEDA